MHRIRQSFILFFILAAVQGMAANFAHPVTPTLIQNLGLPSYSFGLFYAGMAFTNFLFSPMWAKQTKKLGSKTVLGICCIGYAIGQALFASFTSIVPIMCARMLSGFFVGGIMVSYLTYIVSRAPEEKTATYLATSATISTVSASFGYFIGGMIGSTVVYHAFWLQVATLCICGVLFFCCLQDDRQQDASVNLVKDANPFAAFLDARKFLTPLFALVFVCVLISSMATTCFDQSFNYYINDVFGLTSVYNGTIKAVVGIISLIANMTICIWILKKTNFKRSAVLIFFGCTATLLSLSFTSSLAIFFGIVILFFALNSIYVPILQNICVTDAHKEDQGLVVGFYNAIKSFGMILGALYAGIIYDFNNTLPFISAGILFGVTMVILQYYRVRQQSK